MDIKDAVAGKLIISCQALPDEPLFSPAHMAAMARAAADGGAAAIRANTPEDIAAIRRAVDLPIFGIYKITHPDSEVYITPDFESARAVVEAGADVVALDATPRPRPGGVQLADLVRYIHDDLGVPVMADISNLEEAVEAKCLGADFIATTLAGYTPYTASRKNGPDFELLAAVVDAVRKPVIAEGRIETPAQARRALEIGAHAVVVGSAITRPQQIARRFVEEMAKARRGEVALGIDIGATFIKAGLVDRRGHILATERVPCPVTSGPRAIVETVESAARSLLKQLPPDRPLAGVGVGSAGQIDHRTGVVVAATDNIPGWAGTRLGDEIARRLHLPVVVDNDANVAALGEAVFGAARGTYLSVTLTLGTGVGGGVVVDGRVIRGAHHVAGNFGHLKLSRDGLPCTCGQAGCLEAYVGSHAILERAARVMGRRVTSVAEISAAVEAGDSQAGQVLYETGYYLGMGISNIVNSFNPDVIVLAGGVAGAGEHLLRGVRDAVRELSLPPAAEQTRIEVSTQGEWAGVVGGSCLVWEAAPV